MKKFCPFMSYRTKDKYSGEDILVDCDKMCSLWDDWRGCCGLKLDIKPPTKQFESVRGKDEM